MATTIEYGQLYIGNVYKEHKDSANLLLSKLGNEPDYLIMPIKKINKFKVLVYDFKHDQQMEYSVGHFKQKNFVKLESQL